MHTFGKHFNCLTPEFHAVPQLCKRGNTGQKAASQKCLQVFCFRTWRVGGFLAANSISNITGVKRAK